MKWRAALFDAAKAWLVERGMTVLRGPVNPSMNYECGLLIDGFDSPPTFMMTYNPPYYADLIERQGLVKSQDLLAFWGHVEMLKELDAKLKFVSGEATRRFGVTVRRANTKTSSKRFVTSSTSTTSRCQVSGASFP